MSRCKEKNGNKKSRTRLMTTTTTRPLALLLERKSFLRARGIFLLATGLDYSYQRYIYADKQIYDGDQSASNYYIRRPSDGAFLMVGCYDRCCLQFSSRTMRFVVLFRSWRPSNIGSQMKRASRRDKRL